MTKILICEDWVYTGRLIGDEAEKDDYAVVVLAKDNDKNGVIDNLELVVREIQPDYMITDGLNGRCFEAIELARKVKTDLVAILYTSSGDLIERAKENGIPAYRKHSFQELDNMFWYIVEHKRNKRN